MMDKEPEQCKMSLDLYVLHCKMCYIVKCSLVWKSISLNFIEKRSRTGHFMFYIVEFSDISVFSLLSEKERNGTWVQHLYIAFYSHTIYSFTVLRSAPLRETMMGTHLFFPSSNGAERSAFDNDGNIAISLAIQYFPAPLRSVPIIHSLTERSGMLLTVMGTLEFL